MRQRLLFISLALIIFSLAGGFGLQYAMAVVWTEPSALPPGDNVPAPINVGAGAQIKTGDLTVGGNFSVGQGQIVGAPAGGNMGLGTLNAEQLCIQGNCRVNWPEAVNAFVDEGNVGFGPTAVLGTNDNVPLSFETNGVGRVQVGAAGNVGIGTTNTAFNLMVGGVAPRIYFLPAPGSNPELDFGSPAMDTHWAIYRDAATDQLRFWRNNNNLVLTSAGNVGVGTDNPLYKLTIAGTAPREYLWPSGGGNPELDFGNQAGDSHWAIYRDVASDQLRFWRNDDKIILASDGNVGIGTNPAYKLDVAGQINASTNLTPAIQGVSSGDAGGFFQSDGIGGVGVYGIANNQSSFGLYGLASGESSTAVSGTASSLAGLNKGGSFFAGNASIVTGGDNNIGVMAAGGGSPGKNYGGYFKAQGSGYGVYSVVTDAAAWSGYFTGGQGVYGDAGVVGAAAGGYRGAGTLNAIQLCIQGNCLGAWPAGAAPGGVNGQIQFNDSGIFSGDTGLTFDKATDVLTIGGNLKVGMAAGGDDDFIYFDDGTKYIKWVNVQEMFNFSSGILSDAFLSGTQITARSGGYNQAVDAANTKSINMRHTGVYGLLSTESANPGTDAGNLVLKADPDYPADYVEIADELKINSTLTLLGAGIFSNDLTVSGNVRVGGGSIVVYRCVDGAPANEGALVADYGGGEPKAFCGGAFFADTGLRVK